MTQHIRCSLTRKGVRDVSSVPGIGVGTVVSALWTKRMSGTDSYDPSGQFCQWGWEPIECRGHPFGFDWKEHRADHSKIRNATDTEENAKLERPPQFRKLFNAAVQQELKTVSAFGGSRHYRIAAFGRGSELRYVASTMGWKLHQIQTAKVQDNVANSEVQVVEASPGVYVAYPIEWFIAKIKSDYVKVTLISGSGVLYCRDKMEREVLDTSAGGCHV